MIISVRDSKKLSKQAAGLTAIIAACTAIAKSKKTLIMQLTPADDTSVLNLLYGKALKEQDISSVYRRYEDDGLDALFIRAETTDLTTEHFNECVTPLFEKENLLDVLKPTKQIDYKKVINLDNLGDILKSAQETYDYIYIYVPFMDKDVVERIKKVADENIVAIPQGEKVTLEDTNDTVVVCDFDFNSRFDLKHMKKMYGVKKMYYIPYNIEYRDSMITETVLDFMLRNKKSMKEDSNYAFTSSLLSLVTQYVVGNDKDDDELEEEAKIKEKMPKERNREAADLKEISGNSVQEVTVKKGLFKKETKLMIHM